MARRYNEGGGTKVRAEIITKTVVDERGEESTIRTNGLNEEQLATMLTLAGKFADDPGFIERGREGTAEFRRRIQEEEERALARDGRRLD
jgi:hypothetical protein